jgi:hypothetical protein
VSTCTHPQGVQDGALDPLTLSSAVAAKLRVLDISGCRYMRYIDIVRSCVQLRCLWMPDLSNVSDLSALAACSETLQELWMACCTSVMSLDPLKACTRLRKLDVRSCNSDLRNQVQDLRLACTQMADPASVKIEGLVHELQPGIPPGMQERAAYALLDLSRRGGLEKAAIAAAGAIPALVQLLRPGPLILVQQQVHWVAWLLDILRTSPPSPLLVLFRYWCSCREAHLYMCGQTQHTHTVPPGCLPCLGRGCHFQNRQTHSIQYNTMILFHADWSLKAARHPRVHRCTCVT